MTGPAPAEAARRGRLVISERAVARMAAAAAAEVEHVGDPRAAPRRRGPGRARGGTALPARGLPRCSARVYGRDARVSLRLSVDYPAGVAAVCDDVRAHVMARLLDLAGLRVEAVNVTVPALRVSDLWPDDPVTTVTRRAVAGSVPRR